jgi:glycerol uptake facilitator protein
MAKAQHTSRAQRGERRWRWQRTTLGELASEFLGTFVLIAFGCGVVATAVAALTESGRVAQTTSTAGDWLLICFGWGAAVTFGVYVAGGVSGAHLNPAVTLAQAARRGFPWSKVPSYCAAQLLGAFAGAALVYFNYRYAISALEGTKHIVRGTPESAATFGIFGTTPAPYFHDWVGPFFDQVIGTAFLVAFIFAVTDAYNAPVKGNLAPIAVGLVVVAIGMSFGANAGYAINPARDLGPRLLAWLEGWGSVAVPGDYGKVNAYIWIPIVGPLVGGLIGAFVYDFSVRGVLKARGVQPDPDVEERAETDLDVPH